MISKCAFAMLLAAKGEQRAESREHQTVSAYMQRQMDEIAIQRWCGFSLWLVVSRDSSAL